MNHLTVLVAWHDSGWNGRICKNPKENKFCEVPVWIRRGKYGFYNVMENNIVKYKRIPNSDCNSNRDQPYRVAIGNKWYVCPFEIRMFDNENNSLIYALVGKRIRNMDKYNKIADFIEKLEYFYNNSKSLCFVHCNESPFESKIVCACIKPREKLIKLRTDESSKDGVKFTEKLVEFKDIIERVEKGEKLVEEERDNITKVMKRRSYFTIEMTYRPEDVVFIIPYQELAEYYGGYDEIPEEYILEVPQEASKSFYNSFLSNELAISILEQALRIVEKINKELKDNPKLFDYLKMFREKFMLEFSEFPERIKNCLRELKAIKFRYPGLSAVLRYLGVDNAVSFHIDAVKDGREEDMYNTVKNALTRKEECLEFGINMDVINKFNGMNKDKRTFLVDYLPYYNLMRHQIEEILKQYDKDFINLKDVLDNPYLLYEDLKPKEDFEITFWEIDGWEYNRQDKFDIIDKRRIRAMLIAILRKAKSDGHTILPLPQENLPSVRLTLRDYFNRINDLLPDERKMDFERFLELIDKYKDFISEKVWIGETDFKDEIGRIYKVRLFALKEIRDKEQYIEEFINKMLEKEHSVSVSDDEIEKLLREDRPPKGISEEEYDRAIKNQVVAVKIMLKNGCSILTGLAGSGKTYTIKALLKLICEHEKPRRVVILAPTGKASVRIREVLKSEKDKMGNILDAYREIEEPMTIHRFLTKYGNFDWEYYTFKPRGKQSIDVLIIDEASMVGTELLHDLLQCIDETRLKRLIFVGDANQLPPIEAGKPFFDLYNHLLRKEDEGKGKYIAKLEVCLRSESRKIVELSRLFIGSIDKSEKERIIDELIGSRENINDNLVKYSLKDNDGTEKVVVLVWQGDENRFYEALEYAIDELIKENNGNPNNYREFFKHFVFDDEIQILTPTKMKGKFGSFKINQWIRVDSKYTEGKRELFIRQDFVCGKGFADKVIQTVNNWNLDVYDYINGKRVRRHGVFNGMMGYVSYTSTSGKVVKFYFPKVQAFIRHDQIKYAYAITTHKSQGSEFDNVIFVLPRSRFISKELMYTALTRAVKRLFIITDDISNQFDYNHSELGKRYSILFNACIDPRAYPENLRIITLKGDIVRSWQECLIANLLYYENMNYSYEPSLEISDKSVVPDFRLYSEYDKTILWEHFGMMDYENYRNYVNEKIKLYETNGYAIVELKSMNEQKLTEIFDKYNKILIVSYPEDVRNSKDLYDKIKTLKRCLHIKNAT